MLAGCTCMCLRSFVTRWSARGSERVSQHERDFRSKQKLFAWLCYNNNQLMRTREYRKIFLQFVVWHIMNTGTICLRCFLLGGRFLGKEKPLGAPGCHKRMIHASPSEDRFSIVGNFRWEKTDRWRYVRENPWNWNSRRGCSCGLLYLWRW